MTISTQAYLGNTGYCTCRSSSGLARGAGTTSHKRRRIASRRSPHSPIALRSPRGTSYLRSRAVLDGEPSGPTPRHFRLGHGYVRAILRNEPALYSRLEGDRFCSASYLSQVAERCLRKRNAFRCVRGKSAMGWIPLEVPTFCPQKFPSLFTFTSYHDSGHVETESLS